MWEYVGTNAQHYKDENRPHLFPEKFAQSLWCYQCVLATATALKYHRLYYLDSIL